MFSNDFFFFPIWNPIKISCLVQTQKGYFIGYIFHSQISDIICGF